MNDKPLLTDFSFEDQVMELANYLNKIGSLELDKEMEIKFLVRKEKELGEEFKSIEAKEEKLINETKDILLEMSSRIKAIKELKMKIMQEREKCVKRYTSLTQGDSVNGATKTA